MTELTTKICPVCAETIKIAAKRCPFCRTDVRRSNIRLDAAPWVSWLFLLLFFCAAVVVFYRVTYPGKDFAAFRNQLVVSSSFMQFNAGEKGRYVTTLGTLKNDSDVGWKEVQVEVRYFNHSGKMIDVGVQFFPDVIVQPHSESAFRVRTLADQPDSFYASHVAVVRTAKDIRRWP